MGLDGNKGEQMAQIKERENGQSQRGDREGESDDAQERIKTEGSSE